jgi:hypothetical protein
MVAFDARRALAIERREYDKASLIEQEREDVAIERFALVRALWWPALKAAHP